MAAQCRGRGRILRPCSLGTHRLFHNPKRESTAPGRR
jgi:hypothetical protein